MASKEVTVRKRQQIETANRTMFLWVAGAAIIVGVALVLSTSLFERLAYNQKVLNEKNQTVGNLRHNNDIVDELKENARVLNTNLDLFKTPHPDSRQPISVVLDALPSQANSSALGASLQQHLLNNGVTIDSLTVEPISGIEDDSDSESSSDSDSDSEAHEINFDFTVSAPAHQNDKLKEVLRNLERSIRTINVTSVTIEQQSSRISLSVEGVAYYEPEVKVELEAKEVPL